MARTLGNIFDQAMALALLGESKLTQNQLEEACTHFAAALHFADRSGAAPLALKILIDVAQLLDHAEVNRSQEATELRRYVAHHPGIEADIRMQAEAGLIEFEAVLGARDSTGHDIWAVVANLHIRNYCHTLAAEASAMTEQLDHLTELIHHLAIHSQHRGTKP